MNERRIGFILSLLAPFRWIIQKMGADYNQFIRLLQLKLTMDSRRQRSSNAMGGSMSKQIFFQVFIGFLFASLLFKINLPSPYIYIIIHTMTMVMMALTIITEFTTIIFDTSENAILLPLPVKSNTVSLARYVHIALYLTSIAFFLTFPAIILALFKFGILSGFLFLLTILLNAFFTLFLANILYLGIMRFASAEKLKNIVMYFQIFVTIITIGGMQLGSTLVTKNLFTGKLLADHWYNFLFPPAFFAGFIDAITNFNFDLQHQLFIAETLTVPLLAIYVTNKYLASAFNRKLLELEQGDRGLKSGKSRRKKKGLWFSLMSPLFVHNAHEKASFTMVWEMIGRERQFKQTFLPSIGILIIVFVAQYIRKPLDPNQLTQSHNYLSLLYFTGLAAINLIGALQIGNNKQAVWILKTIPLDSPADFFKGSIKAAFARFFLPFYLLVSIVIIGFFGIGALWDSIIVLLLIYPMTSFFYYFQNLNFPFTMEKDAARGGERTMKTLLLLVILLPLGYLHKYLLQQASYINLILIPVYLALICYVNRILVYRRINWENVNKENGIN